jgi:hypothetical protein
LIALPIVLLVGPWLARNQAHYGTLLPERVTDRRLFPDGLATALAAPDRVADLLVIGTEDGLMGLGSPFWLFTPRVPVKAVEIVTGSLLGLLPLVGIGLAARRAGRGQATPERQTRQTFWMALAASLVLFWLLVLTMGTRDWNVVLFGGRYLWEAAGAVGLLWTLGLFGLPAGRVRGGVIAFVLVGMAALSIMVQQWVLAA